MKKNKNIEINFKDIKDINDIIKKNLDNILNRSEINKKIIEYFILTQPNILNLIDGIRVEKDNQKLIIEEEIKIKKDILINNNLKFFLKYLNETFLKCPIYLFSEVALSIKKQNFSDIIKVYIEIPYEDISPEGCHYSFLNEEEKDNVFDNMITVFNEIYEVEKTLTDKDCIKTEKNIELTELFTDSFLELPYFIQKEKIEYKKFIKIDTLNFIIEEEYKKFLEDFEKVKEKSYPEFERQLSMIKNIKHF
tara:strand:- start:7611 stop:8360 length:750 start_codon:yes stop_codon:yes gene_type:complete